MGGPAQSLFTIYRRSGYCLAVISCEGRRRFSTAEGLVIR